MADALREKAESHGIALAIAKIGIIINAD